MPRLLLRVACTFFCTFQVMTAQALIQLPEACQGEEFNFACEPGYGPHHSEIGLRVGNAILEKLINNDPEAALPLLATNFLQDWAAAWTSFPVPATIEAAIGGLSTHDFAQWVDWLCLNLQPDANSPSAINFAAMPLVVVNSAPQVAATAVPLPTSLWLFTSAILGLTVGGKRRKK